jgi:hypothetical protein
MATPMETALHVIDTELAGESAALAIGTADPVLVLGNAHEARAIAQILSRPVSSARRPATRIGRERLAERVRTNAGAASLAWHGTGSDESTAVDVEPEGLGRLPDRASARAALGLGDELVLAPLSDRPADVDARTMLFIAGVIEIIGEPIAVALPAAARRLDEALTYHRSAGLAAPVRIVDDAWLCALPAADVLIAPIDFDHDPAAAVLTAIAGRLGVPVATTAAWHRDVDAATNSLPSEIRATVAPVLERARAVRTNGVHAATATVPT